MQLRDDACEVTLLRHETRYYPITTLLFSAAITASSNKKSRGTRIARSSCRLLNAIYFLDVT